MEQTHSYPDRWHCTGVIQAIFLEKPFEMQTGTAIDMESGNQTVNPNYYLKAYLYANYFNEVFVGSGTELGFQMLSLSDPLMTQSNQN